AGKYHGGAVWNPGSFEQQQHAWRHGRSVGMLSRWRATGPGKRQDRRRTGNPAFRDWQPDGDGLDHGVFHGPALRDGVQPGAAADLGWDADVLPGRFL